MARPRSGRWMDDREQERRADGDSTWIVFEPAGSAGVTARTGAGAILSHVTSIPIPPRLTPDETRAWIETWSEVHAQSALRLSPLERTTRLRRRRVARRGDRAT